jgi:hypothetical protein
VATGMMLLLVMVLIKHYLQDKQQEQNLAYILVLMEQQKPMKITELLVKVKSIY